MDTCHIQEKCRGHLPYTGEAPWTPHNHAAKGDGGRSGRWGQIRAKVHASHIDRQSDIGPGDDRPESVDGRNGVVGEPRSGGR